MRAQTPVRTDPLTLPIKEAVGFSGLSRSCIYLGMKTGKIRYKKIGRRTLVVTESLKAFVESIPDAVPAPVGYQPSHNRALSPSVTRAA